jgi:AraC-like DNA-binding protein
MKNQNLILHCGACIEMNDPSNRHFHDEFELLYISRGSAKVIVDKKEYELSRGMITFIGHLEEHSITMLSEDYLYYYLIINSNQFEQLIHEPRLISIFRNRSAYFTHTLQFAEQADNLDTCFAAICKEVDIRSPYYNEMINSYLTQILIGAYRKEPREFDFINTNMTSVIYSIEKYLEENFMSDIRISDIADSYYVSLNYLSKCFHALSGYTPKQYLSQCRIANAKSMLIHTDASVQNIAIKCGFNDVNNFIRKFKEETGITPYKYKENSK